jgi:hypothetical protein
MTAAALRPRTAREDNSRMSRSMLRLSALLVARRFLAQ